jgi:hypothetical protein
MSLWKWLDKNVVQPIKKNPVGLLVNVGLMAMGVPPVYAAAAGGAAGAAAQGGSGKDIIKGAFTGGAMAYVGGAAAGRVASAGYGQAISGAAGGAASGATGAILTGGNIGQAALTGGLVGGTIGGVTQYLAGSGAVNPAAAGSQMSANDYYNSIPDDVLANALKSDNPVSYVNKAMGFTGQGTSAVAVNRALADYTAASTPIGGPIAPVDINTALSAANAPGVVDPLGTLINKMQWTPGGAAIAATVAPIASGSGKVNPAAAGSQMTRAQYAESIPDNVLAEAIKTSDPVGYVNKAMGYPGQGLSAGGVNDALRDYRAASTPIGGPAPVAPVAPVDINTALSAANAPGVVDPLGTLINQMGWSPGAAASVTSSVADAYGQEQAKQAAAQRQSNLTSAQKSNMNVRLPGLLSEANNNPNLNDILSQSNGDKGMLLRKLGWSDNQFTNEAAQQILDNYRAESTAATNLANQQAEYIRTHQVTASPTSVATTSPAPDLIDIGGGNYMDTNGNITDISGNITQPMPTPGPAQYPTANVNTGVEVDVAGRAGMVGSESALRGPITSGATLATPDQVNNGTATYNPNNNAWEVTPLQPLQPTPITPSQPVTNVDITPVAPAPAPQVISSFNGIDPTTGVLMTVLAYNNGTTRVVPASSVPQNTSSGSAPVTPQVPKDTSSTITAGTGTTTGTGTAPSVTVPGQTDDGTIIVRGDREPLIPLIPGNSTPRPPVVNVDLTQQPPLIPLTPGDSTPRPPVVNVDITEPPVSPGGPDTPDKVIHQPDPVIPIPPTIPDATKPSTHYGTYTWGNVPDLQIPTGLNPGYIQPTDFYKTDDPVQSHYYWGGHPYQPGPTFDQALYNRVPNAPGTPWGLQQSFNPNYNYPITQYMPPQQYLPVAP